MQIITSYYSCRLRHDDGDDDGVADVGGAGWLTDSRLGGWVRLMCLLVAGGWLHRVGRVAEE
eukprot:COSAG02_NODE_186_length_30414_cov_24.815372_22_plen_62_part_00